MMTFPRIIEHLCNHVALKAKLVTIDCLKINIYKNKLLKS